MLVQVNGESREVPDQSMLDDLVRELTLEPARIAVELNQQVVRRDKWRQTSLQEGDRVEIVHFVGGGADCSRITLSSKDGKLEFSVPEEPMFREPWSKRL